MTFDDQDRTKKLVAGHPFKWRVVPGAKTLIDQLGVKAYPTFALLDSAGKLIEFKQGLSINEKSNALEKWIEGIIAAQNK
ncbi:hypothetical protein QN372_18285 [Undibacterium sp. RTI2.1]|uniref:TlpA family protein disulfide reductase n=1 Tax=unclassified Undibacterium TaxID=2630295 RepID=UPI002AB5475E|nr:MULTISPECIES: hypothetical protein [unclassified Undibacterium]MDY7538615.1 hypothetical protein [Undibacterium sp. 5I1]MEB0032701.1 hypothetical protein [Undibacterium sp. RTI2.1]MEB0116303.1 hypothetical protein [Undibacterium sp. RTI2.2]MEB0231458.1 hypothetical protein [Undibacterium sp. 10I3]MEB0258117.1 hypothetical protein [Undibacterium sp. 5I1]